jgi:hypothetical protein
MSVFSAPKPQIFRATVATGPSSASIVSSWEKKHVLTYNDYKRSPHVCCIARIANFIHTFNGKECMCILDWLVLKETNAMQYSVELKLIHPSVIDIAMLGITEKVNSMINKNLFVLKLQQLFQQAHPGDLSGSGISGNAGKEGDSQSD